MKLYRLGRRDFVQLAALGGAAAALPRWLRAGIRESEYALATDLGLDTQFVEASSQIDDPSASTR